MRRVVFLLLLLGLCGGLAAQAASVRPALRSASVQRGRLDARFWLGPLLPGELVVSTSPARLASGAPALAFVRLRLKLPSAARTHVSLTARLAPGIYYAEISGLNEDAVTGCVVLRGGCLERWSTPLRIDVR